MDDIRLLWDNTEGVGDIAFVAGDFKTGKPIETAVYLSLFCDARADDSSGVVDPDMRRGWWGDLLRTVSHSTGSNIWQLEREKITQSILNSIKSYCENALQWMVDDEIVNSFEVTIDKNVDEPETPIVILSVILYRGDATVADIRYTDFWNAQIEED
jgi:phage gp46-like protein